MRITSPSCLPTFQAPRIIWPETSARARLAAARRLAYSPLHFVTKAVAPEALRLNRLA